MSGRTYVLILFFWAALTIVTPVLVRLSANAKENMHYSDADEMREGLKASGVMGLLPRRALVSMAPSRASAPARAPAPAPAWAPAPEGEVVLGVKRLLEVRQRFQMFQY